MRTSSSMGLGRERGLASVELAVMIPIFVMLMLATAELGRALYQYNTLSKAVRDGAQYVARHCFAVGSCTPSAAVQTTAKNLIVYGMPSPPSGTATLLPGFTTANVTVTAPVSVTKVTVSATYTYVPILLAIPTFGFGGITRPTTMNASVTMVGL